MTDMSDRTIRAAADRRRFMPAGAGAALALPFAGG